MDPKVSQICKVCQAYMQFRPDPKEPADHNKYLKCPTCGFTKLAKEQLPPIPTDKEIEEKLKEIEDVIIK